MKKTLVAYFSATGVTAGVAKRLASTIGADLYEIVPAEPYKKNDLIWTDPKSRSSIEMNNLSFRPEMAGDVPDMAQYDKVFLGFPIWWYIAPTIINTFLERCDLQGKTIVPFATSGSSGMGDTNAALENSCPGAALKEGKRFPARVSDEELKMWAESVI